MRLTRDVEFCLIRAKDGEESDGYKFTGYATVFGTETHIRGWEGDFLEEMAKGAFRKTLRERKPVMQFNHGRDARTGQVPIGSFDELREDDQGLYVAGHFFRNDTVEPVREAVEEGAIPGMSITFQVVRDEWRDNKGKLIKGDELRKLLWEPGDRGPLKRKVKEAKLFEAGPVVSPAYTTTSIGLRTAESEPLEQDEVVELYQRTMRQDADEPSDLDRWLEAERTWQWLEAERTHNWLVAETAWRATQTSAEGAAQKGTPAAGKPESDAVRTGTSTRESAKETAERKAPDTQKRTVMTLQELRQRLIELEARQEELGEEFRDSEMPDDTQKEWDDNEAERARVAKSIERIEARMEAVKGLALGGSTERGTDTGRPQRKTPDNIYDLDEIRKAATSPDDFRDQLRDNAMRSIDKARFASVTDKAKAQERAAELLDSADDVYGTLAKRMLNTGSPVYERAFEKVLRQNSTAGLTPEEQRAMLLGTDDQGGFAVPYQLDPTVMLINDGFIGSVRSLARVETIVGKEWQGITTTGINVSRDGSPAGSNDGTNTAGEIGRVAEATEAVDGSFFLEQPTIRVTRVQGFVPFTYEIDQDWGGLRSEITRMLNDAKAREEQESFTLGDGTNQQPLGVVGGLPAGSKVTPTTAETFAAVDLYKVKNALAPRWRANAAWMGNADIYDRIRGFDTAGGAQYWTDLNSDRPDRLIGYPVHENSYMDGSWDTAATAANNLVLLFGDFKQFLIVDRVGMTVELIPNLFGSNGMPVGKRGIYAVWRNNAKVLVSNAFRVLNIATTA